MGPVTTQVMAMRILVEGMETVFHQLKLSLCHQLLECLNGAQHILEGSIAGTAFLPWY